MPKTTKLHNKSTKNEMLEALSKTKGIVSEAAKLLGISRDNHYRWLKEDPEYKAKVDELDNICLDFAESKLFELMDLNNVTAVIFYLKTKGKKRGYIESYQMESISPKPIEIKIIEEPSIYDDISLN